MKEIKFPVKGGQPQGGAKPSIEEQKAALSRALLQKRNSIAEAALYNLLTNGAAVGVNKDANALAAFAVKVADAMIVAERDNVETVHKVVDEAIALKEGLE